MVNKSNYEVSVMKKVISGIVIGALLFGAIPAIAATTSMIGKKVSQEVVIIRDGVKSTKPAIIIDGVTYAPVREVAESVGYSVAYKEGVVTLTSEAAPPLIADTTSENSDLGTLLNERSSLGTKIISLNTDITILDQTIASLESSLADKKAENLINDAMWLNGIEIIEGKLTKQRDARSAKQAELVVLEPQLATLETQINSLKENTPVVYN